MKKIYIIFFTLFVSFYLTACSPQVKKEGIVLGIHENKISEMSTKSFPFEKEFSLGKLNLKKPTIKMDKQKNKIQTSVELGLKTIFTGEIKGSFTILAEPIYNKNDSSIYLQNIVLKDFNFGRLKISDEFSSTFKKELSPFINYIFKNYPIYTIPNDSIKGKFVKDIKVGENKLLVTYGI